MNVSLRQIRYFDALVRERHFGRAAESAAISQPALSQQIKELETMLGGALVIRKTTPLALTPLGRKVSLHAREILAAVEKLSVIGRQAAEPAEVMLGIIPTIAPYLVPALLPLVREAGYGLVLKEAVTEVLLTSLTDGALDAVLLALPIDQQDLYVEEVFSDRFLLALPEGGDPSGLPTRPEDIDGERLLLLDEGHCLADQALSACKLQRRRGAALGAASLSTIARLVSSGQGITLLPEIAAKVEGHGLRLHQFTEAEPLRQVALITRVGAEESSWFRQLAADIRAAHAQI